MSKTADTTVTVVTDETVETVEKQSFVQKAIAPIKKHPKIAIAVAAGVALVGGAALSGRKTADSTDYDPSETYEETLVEPEDADTTVA